MQSWRDPFLRDLQISKSPRTVEAYRYNVGHFEDFLRDLGVDVTTASKDALQQFVRMLYEDQQLRAKTIHWRVSAVRRYLRWCVEHDIAVPTFYKPELPRLREEEPAVLWPDQLRRFLIEAKQCREPFATALQLFPLTGLRRAEMAQLKLKDVQLQPIVSLKIHGQGDVRIKGKRDRSVPPLKAARPILQHYFVNVRPTLKANEWLFPRPKGGHVTPRQLGDRVKTIRRRLDIEQMTTHTLRHSFATECQRAGMPDAAIQRLMGHAKLETTARYLHYTPEQLADIVQGIDVSWTD